MRRSQLNVSFIFAINVIFASCADNDARVEEPIFSDQADDSPVNADENGGEEAPAKSDGQQESIDDEAAQDGALSEPSGAMPEAAPSEKGGIISSGAKDKKRCSLIADELERQKCLRALRK